MTKGNPTALFEGFDVELTGVQTSARTGLSVHVDLSRSVEGLDEEAVERLHAERDAVADGFDDVEDADWRMSELDADRAPAMLWWSFLIEARSTEAIAELEALLAAHTPWQAGRGKVRFRAEADMPGEGSADLDVEDGGQAMIAQIEDEGEPHLFVRIQSWHEGARRGDAGTHPTMRSLLGRRVRVTIEDIGPGGGER